MQQPIQRCKPQAVTAHGFCQVDAHGLGQIPQQEVASAIRCIVVAHGRLPFAKPGLSGVDPKVIHTGNAVCRQSALINIKSCGPTLGRAALFTMTLYKSQEVPQRTQ